MTDLKQGNDWDFVEADDDEFPFWKCQWAESKESFLVIWPVITESGTISFSYGHAYDDEGWFEFQQVGYGWKSLEEAKQKCESWGENNTPDSA